MVIVSSMDAADRDDLGGRARRIDQRSLAPAAVMSGVGASPDQVRALMVICTYDSLNKIKNGRTAYEFSVVREALHGLHECGPVLFDSLGRPGVVVCCSLQPAGLAGR
ncbi:hypothetical protein ACWGIA_40535 [Streptomyces bobili]